MSSVYNDASYNIAERRNYDPRDGSWSNKRAKIRYIRESSGDPEPSLTKRGPNPRWCDDDDELDEIHATGQKYLQQFQTLNTALSQYGLTDIDLETLHRAEIIEQIKWIEDGLYDSPAEISYLGDEDLNPIHHYRKLMSALTEVTSFLESLYHFDHIRDIREQHGWKIHHEYLHTTSNDVANRNFVKWGTTTKKLLKNEYFIALVVYLNRILPITPEAQLTRETVKNVILDMDAIENNLPPPTFVKCDKAKLIYEIEMISRFPRPKWMDLPWKPDQPLESKYLPGKFPESPQHSRLKYDFHGHVKSVPNAATRSIPPPFPPQSGPGSLDSPSKKRPREDPMWKVVNAGRVDKKLKRCKVCKNMPYRCNVLNCGLWDKPFTPRASRQRHSPHHHTVSAPPGIIKRDANRYDAQEVASHLTDKGVTFTDITAIPSDLTPPDSKTFKHSPQGFDQSLDHHFNDSTTSETPHSQSNASKEYILHLQDEARAALAAQNARELEAKLARTGGLRPPNKKLIEDLSEEAVYRVHATLQAGHTTDLAKTGEGVELRRSDFAKVVPATEWLNDEIVNGALNWLDRAVNSAAGIKNVRTQTRKCAVFNSFFFKMLREQGVKKGVRPLGRMGIKKENFFEIDTLLLPICENSHWTLLVVRPSKRTVAHMDSLNPRGNASFTNLALAWLKEFLQDDFVHEDWKVVRHEAPRQVNGWDCGVHIITNAMCLALSLNPIETYLASDMPMQRLRVADMLLNGGFHGEYSLQAF